MIQITVTLILILVAILLTGFAFGVSAMMKAGGPEVAWGAQAAIAALLILAVAWIVVNRK